MCCQVLKIEREEKKAGERRKREKEEEGNDEEKGGSKGGERMIGKTKEDGVQEETAAFCLKERRCQKRSNGHQKN